jgi:hypothetical protein
MSPRKIIGLTLMGAAVVLVGLSTRPLAAGESKDSIIQEALDEGATMVKCRSGVCRDMRTQEVVGSGGDSGPFLVFPDTVDGRAAQARTQQKLKQLS